MSIREVADTELVPGSHLLTGVVSIDPARHSGTPCFAGTRVPVQDLWDYLAGGETLNSFLDSFPTVSREQAIQVIELAARRLVEGLRSA
jgi:uncharacterized protein (DUF433 family)